MHLVILILVLISPVSTAGANSDKKEDLSFSNTQKWSSGIIHLVKTWKPIWVSFSKQEAQIINNMSPPPGNESNQMSREIDTLLQLQVVRSKHEMTEIKEEVVVCGWDMAGYLMGMNKALDDFLVDIFFDVTTAGYKLKRDFDRVRPSYYDKRITPSISVPKHPAYPSNHSIQTHVLALNLADIFPEKRTELLKSAFRITKNREIAGVHYESDSEMGRKIAKTLHQKLSQNSNYQQTVNKLKRKYNNNKDIFSSFSKKNKRQCKAFIGEFRQAAGLNIRKD